MRTGVHAHTPPEFIRQKERAVGIVFAVTVVLLFSSFTLVSRMGFGSTLKPIDMAALRFGIGGLILAPVLLRHGLVGVRWRDAAALAFCGGLGFALFAYTGFSLAPASHGAVMLHGTLPLFTFAMGWLVSTANATGRRALGYLVILIGIAVMAWDSLSGSTRPQLLGDACLLLAAVCWSAYGLLARRMGLAPVHAAALVAVLSMACFVPVYLLLPGKALFLASWQDIVVQGLFQGVLIGVVSIFVYLRAVASLGAMETALFASAVPAVTTLAAVFLLGEVPGAMALLGVVVVTMGMVLSMQRPGQDARDDPTISPDTGTRIHPIPDEKHVLTDTLFASRCRPETRCESQLFTMDQFERSWWERSS